MILTLKQLSAQKAINSPEIQDYINLLDNNRSTILGKRRRPYHRAHNILPADVWNILSKCLWYNYDYCLKMVKKDGLHISNIKVNPTIELFTEACKQNGFAIKYIDNPNDEICLAAVRQNGHSLWYIEDQKEIYCEAALQNTMHAIQEIRAPTNIMIINSIKMYVKARMDEYDD